MKIRNTRLRFVCIVVAALIMLIPPRGLRAQPAQTIEQLVAQLHANFTALGLGIAEGMGLLVEGLARAIPGTAAEARAHAVGFRNLVRHGLANNQTFLRSVVATMTWLMDRGILTPQTARTIGHGATWSPRAGAVAVQPFLTVMAAGVVGLAFLAEGYEYTTIFLAELEQTVSEAEAKAYSDLMKLLIDRTTRGNVELCEGMSYGESATRLRINMQTSPQQPFWRIACPKTTTTTSASLKPNLSCAWSSTYGAIHWGQGWYGAKTKTITGQLASESGQYVYRGSWGRTNSKRAGQLVFVFDSPTAFSGYWTEGQSAKRTNWSGSGSCQ